MIASGQKRTFRAIAIYVCTGLMGHDETGIFHRLTKMREQVLEPLIGEHRGRVVKRMGGGTLPNRSEVLGVKVGQEPVEGLRLLDVH